jgi:glycosyltransferase involved in cell wall biosynthesis
VPFRALLPLFFAAMQRFDLSGYDLVVSSSHCVAHAVRAPRNALHVAYVHSPMRYLYDQMTHYLPPYGRVLSEPVARALTVPLRAWDRRAAAGPHALWANSRFVAQRIARVWGRPSAVIYPPVDVAFFAASQPVSVRQGLLCVGALVPYKRADLAVQLSNRTGVPLTVVGRGPERERLGRMAGPQVTFLEGLGRAALRAHYSRAQALVYGGEEDFGIVPVEAMATGCPILALGRGGLGETVCTAGTQATGVLVAEATVAAFVAGWHALQALRQAGHLGPEVLRAHARRFATPAFHHAVRAALVEPLRARRLALCAPV